MSITAQVDYTSKDFDGLKASLLDYAAQILPEWQSRSEGDFGVVLVELLAYTGDILSYYGDRIQDEAYLATASTRQSILQIANLLGYTPSNGVAATGTVTFQTANPGPAVLVPAGTAVVTDYNLTADGPLTYETVADVTVPLNGGTASVGVVHGVTKTLVPLGTSTGLPAQQFRLPDTSILTDTVRIFVDAAAAGTGVVTPLEWNSIGYLIDADPSTQAFSTFVDSTGATWVSFGDNLNGAIPTLGLNVYATYRVGGGAVGNLVANQIIGISSATVSGVSIATDGTGKPLSSAMAGGADPESNDQIRVNAPRVFRTQNRLVTLQDFSDAELAVPGVLRANAVAGTFSSVTTYVVGPDGGPPSSTLTNTVQSALNAQALAGVTATVAGPVIVPINLGTITVQALSGFKTSAVTADVTTAIKTFLSFANVDFATRVTISDFYSVIRSVNGVQWVQIPLMARNDAAQTGTADIVCRDWEIPTIGTFSLNVLGGTQ